VKPQGCSNSQQQILIEYRFVKKGYRPRSKRAFTEGSFNEAGDKDDWDASRHARQIVLQLKPAHSGQPQVEHQAQRLIQIALHQKVLG